MKIIDAINNRPGCIAFSHYSAANDVSGVTTWLENLLLRLSADGVPLAVLLHHFGDNVEQSSLLESLRAAGIHVEIVPRKSSLSEDVLTTLEFLNRHQPLVFLPQCLEAMFFAANIAGHQGLPWVLTLHSDEDIYWAIAEETSPETCNGALVGVSKYLCSLSERKGLSTHPFCIPCGVSSSRDKAEFNDKPFRVVYSGRVVEKQKRISLVVETMAHACRQDSRIECVILGQGLDFESARHWVDTQNLGDKIIFLGRLTPDEVRDELARCHVLLLMSDYEGLPVCLLEAMTTGVVPVVRDISSGIPELVVSEHTGLVVDDNPQHAADAIVRLLNDPALWTRCSCAAKTLVERQYSDERSYSLWCDLISELVSHSTAMCYPLTIPKDLKLPKGHSIIGRNYPVSSSLIQRVLKKARHVLCHGNK